VLLVVAVTKPAGLFVAAVQTVTFVGPLVLDFVATVLVFFFFCLFWVPQLQVH